MITQIVSESERWEIVPVWRMSSAFQVLGPLCTRWGRQHVPGELAGPEPCSGDTGQCHHREHTCTKGRACLTDKALTVCPAQGKAFACISHLMSVHPERWPLSTAKVNKQTSGLQARAVGNPVGRFEASVLNELWSQTIWVQIPIMLFSSCVTLASI